MFTLKIEQNTIILVIIYVYVIQAFNKIRLSPIGKYYQDSLEKCINILNTNLDF